jgi:hypothetical protein
MKVQETPRRRQVAGRAMDTGGTLLGIMGLAPRETESEFTSEAKNWTGSHCRLGQQYLAQTEVVGETIASPCLLSAAFFHDLPVVTLKIII